MPLIQSAIEYRRKCYREAIAEQDGLGERFYRRQLARLDKILYACCSPLARLSSMDRAHLHGCIFETHVEPLHDVRCAMADMHDPQWYAFAKDHREEIFHHHTVLTLWNKLKDRKAHKAFDPLPKYEFFEQLRSTVRVYCRFSGTHPYKLALWLADGRVLRIKPLDNFSEFSEPERITDHELREIFTHVLPPAEFCEALRRYGVEFRLNAWQSLLLELLGDGSTAN